MDSTHPDLKFTYHDYLLMPEEKQYELIEGDLYMVPAPNPFHQIVSRRIASDLTAFISGANLGEILYAPCDVYFSQYDVVQPDILFIASDRLGIIQEKFIQGAPDLVVEILSPSSLEKDREIKTKLYSRYGVGEYWIVDPQGKTIEVLTRQEARLVTTGTYREGEELKSPLLEGFELNLSSVFQPIGTAAD